MANTITVNREHFWMLEDALTLYIKVMKTIVFHHQVPNTASEMHAKGYRNDAKVLLKQIRSAM